MSSECRLIIPRYLLIELPSNILLKKVGPNVRLSVISLGARFSLSNTAVDSPFGLHVGHDHCFNKQGAHIYTSRSSQIQLTLT